MVEKVEQNGVESQRSPSVNLPQLTELKSLPSWFSSCINELEETCVFS